MRLVVDSNIFVSGLLFLKSKPGEIIAITRSASCDLLFSEPMFQEVEKVLTYPKIKKLINWDNERIARFIFLLRLFSETVDIKNTKVNVSAKVNVPSGNNDEIILATFVAGKADYLITSDNDLLQLADEYAIVSSNEFLELVF